MARSSRSSPFRFSVLSRPHTPTSPGDARAREARTVFVNGVRRCECERDITKPLLPQIPFHDPRRDAWHARACGVEDGLGVGGLASDLDGGMAVEMLWSNVVREEGAGGRAALAGPRAVGGAGEARLWRARRRRMVMKYVAALGASAPVDVSAARSEVCKKKVK